MTALQELIEILNKSQKFINDNDSKEDKYYRRGLREAIEEANKLLEKEKQQIILSYEQGYQDGRDEHYMSAEFDGAEHYFKETYKQ